MVQKRPSLRRGILACCAILPHLTLPAKIFGDYLIYRTGIAGKLPKFPLPERLVRVWWCTRLVGSLLFLPAVWVTGGCSLARWHVNAVAAVSLSGALTLALYSSIRRFDNTWRYVDEYRVGSAKQLTGKCAIFQVFLGRPWRRRDRARCLLAVRTACDWLEEKAREHEVSLDLMTEPAELRVLDDVMVPARALTYPNRWRAYRYEEDGVLQQLEMLSPRLARMVAERVKRLPPEPDQVCLMVHIPFPDTGFAMCARNDLHLESELELCVCSRKCSASVYAHELLHLFGAPDLYWNPWRTLTQEGETDEALGSLERGFALSFFERFRAHFGNSIMCNAGGLSIERLTIDPITARAIGWRKPDREFLKTVEQVDQALGEGAANALEETFADAPKAQ